MNWLLELALGNALAATVLAGCVWLLCRWVRRPAVRHALWGLVLLRLLFPPIGPVTVPVRGLDGAEAPIVAVGDSESRAFAAMVGP
ncbi:MAG TPA: hypothetical protein VIL46_04200, partial [Gemmataceae bacterium]